MNPQETQVGNPQMTADEAAASLAMATGFQDQMIPREAPVEPETAPQQEETQEVEEDAVSEEDNRIGDLEVIFTEELGGLRDEIKELKDLIKKDGK